jgi:hypothetical protein
MRRMSASLIAWAISAPAFAQAPVVAGETYFAIDLVPDRTVIFEPQADGRLKVIKITEGDGHAPMPRNPGQVAVSMNYAPEIGTVIEFNNGLDYGFSYDAMAVKADSTDPAKFVLLPIDSCPVNGQAVSSDQWPQPYPRIAITKFARKDGVIRCDQG